MPAAGDDAQDSSFFARKFKIPNIASDPSRWNKEWEKALATLSSSEDVYPMMSDIWKQDRWDVSELSKTTQGLNDQVHKLQGILVELWDKMEEDGHFVSAWLLLDEGERKRHLMNGLKEACEHASWAQDARALCPEITLSSMLKQRGRAFTDFVSDYSKAAKKVDAGTLYFLPSEWWQKAVDMPEPWSEEVQSTYAILTLQRNEFISESIDAHGYRGITENILDG